MPFTDTIYLPALGVVAEELKAPQSAVAATVSVYMATVAIGQLLFGPLTDRYGRPPVLYSGVLVFEAFTIACVFAPTIDALIALRALEGLFVSSASVSTQAIIADVFAPAERGSAMGAYMSPVLLGPVIAPIIGGALSEGFGWRATFMFLAVLTAPFVLLAFVSLRHETHHWFARRRLAHRHAPAPAVAEAGLVVSGNGGVGGGEPGEAETRPRLMLPWQSLSLAIDPQLAPYYAAISTSFATMFTSITILPIHLAQPPYSLSTTMVGVAFLPFGVVTFIGSLLGGILSDRSLKWYGGPGGARADARMTALLWPLWMCVPGAVGFGYALQVTRARSRRPQDTAVGRRQSAGERASDRPPDSNRPTVRVQV